jgi:alpha-L-rhamnosidase
MGATTIWERWDGIKPDSTFQTPGMNSFNHYAYGAIGDWMYRVVTGIYSEENGNGYKSFVVKPHIGGGLTQASAELKTNYGLVKSSWKIDNTAVHFEVVVPPNSSARIFIPASSEQSIRENGKPLSAIKEIELKGKVDDYVQVIVGSGRYVFDSTR